jgi:NitT/TauT family transport system ATP-binding protein
VIMVTHDVEEAVFLAQRVVVLASDPGRIADTISVDLPPDRPLETKRDQRFLRLRGRVEDMVRAQHHSHLAGTAAPTA